MGGLHRHSMIWGATYSWTELARDQAGRNLRCGMEPIDAAVGELGPGSLLVIAGARGAGVSTLALNYLARAVAEPNMSALMINGHLRPAALLARLDLDEPDSARASGSAAQAAGAIGPQRRVSFASGLAFPAHDRLQGWLWPEPQYDLIIYDTVDESWPLPDEQPTAHERLAIMRGLREAARQAGKTIIGTARIAGPDDGYLPARESWSSHAWYDAMTDAADVVVTVASAPDFSVSFGIQRRGGRDQLITLGLTPDRRPRSNIADSKLRR